MNFTRHTRRRTPSVIIVSLIDVLLVVLIFLMVTTTFKKLEPALQITLPKVAASQASPVEPAKFQILIATNFPFYYFEGQPISIAQLEQQLIARVASHSNLVVSIKADEATPFGVVARVVGIVKTAQPGGMEVITERDP
jgi:biopolymer transport protein ExbD